MISHCAINRIDLNNVSEKFMNIIDKTNLSYDKIFSDVFIYFERIFTSSDLT